MPLPPSLSDATPITFPHTSDLKDDSQERYGELDDEEEREDADADEESDYDSEPLPGIMLQY